MITEADTDTIADDFKPARIILRPTVVRSITDNELHHVTAMELARLYCVPLEHCKVIRDEQVSMGWVPEPNDLVLHVRYDDKYHPIPTEWYA